MPDWGRASANTGKPQRRGFGVLTFFLILIFGALLGAGGVVYNMRYDTIPMPEVRTETDDAELQLKQIRIEELERELADLKKTDADAINLRGVLEEQEKIVTELREENRALTARLDEANKASNTPIDAAPDNQEVEKLREEISGLEARIKLGSEVNSDLEAQLNSAQEETAALQARLDAAFNDEMPKLKTDVAERDKRIATLDAEINRLNALVDRAASERADESTALKELEDSSTAMIGALKEELASVRAKSSERENELTKLGDENARLGEEIARLNSELARSAITEPKPEAGSEQAPAKEETPGTAGNEKGAPRDPLLVASALQSAAGLGNIDDARRDRIATRLIEGECIGSILEDEFGRVPAVTMRDLIRLLESDC